ncbi:MAG: hypothetical protein ACRCYP_04920 [Alphaproteobacteria bacterium]
MSLAKEEAKKLLRKMPPQKQAEVLEKMLKIPMCDINEVRNIIESTTNDVQQVIGLFMIGFLEESSISEKSEKLKERDAEIRKDAIAILNSLIAANPNESEDVLCDRALKMAQRLHRDC